MCLRCRGRIRGIGGAFEARGYMGIPPTTPTGRARARVRARARDAMAQCAQLCALCRRLCTLDRSHTKTNANADNAFAFAFVGEREGLSNGREWVWSRRCIVEGARRHPSSRLPLHHGHDLVVVVGEDEGEGGERGEGASWVRPRRREVDEDEREGEGKGKGRGASSSWLP
ncbi:hypothetical protein OG21DRAFT_272877 [Imleria badia]|nr:hypothetical protein OG21DRAFT_272877 [Imleria badia]